MAMRARILKSVPGKMVRGRFVRTGARNPRNIAAGFHDEEGIFHPIRASFDYDPSRAGERRAPKKKAAAKKKAARKKSAAKPKRKTAAKKKKA